MVDRIGLLMPRLAVAHPTPEARAVAVDGLRELRVGLHTAQLCGCSRRWSRAAWLASAAAKTGRLFEGSDTATARRLPRCWKSWTARCAPSAQPAPAKRASKPPPHWPACAATCSRARPPINRRLHRDC
jgi:hypothetical protein